MTYALTEEEREVFGRVMNPSQVDKYVAQKYAIGGEGAVVDAVANIAAATEPLGYREKRKRAYLPAVSDGEPTFEEAAGDLFDALVKEVARLSTLVGGAPDPDFTNKVQRIAAVKAAIPKPE